MFSWRWAAAAAALGLLLVLGVGRSEAQSPTPMPDCPLTEFNGDPLSLEARFVIECGHCITAAEAAATRTPYFSTQLPTPTRTVTPTLTSAAPSATASGTPGVPNEMYNFYDGQEWIAYAVDVYNSGTDSALPLQPRYKSPFYFPAFTGFRLVGFAWQVDTSPLTEPQREDVSFWSLCMFDCDVVSGSAWSGAADGQNLSSTGCADAEIFTSSYDNICDTFIDQVGSGWANHTYGAFTAGGGGAGYLGYWVSPTSEPEQPTLSPALYPELTANLTAFYERETVGGGGGGSNEPTATLAATLTPSMTLTPSPTNTLEYTGWQKVFNFSLSEDDGDFYVSETGCTGVFRGQWGGSAWGANGDPCFYSHTELDLYRDFDLEAHVTGVDASVSTDTGESEFCPFAFFEPCTTFPAEALSSEQVHFDVDITTDSFRLYWHFAGNFHNLTLHMITFSGDGVCPFFEGCDPFAPLPTLTPTMTLTPSATTTGTPVTTFTRTPTRTPTGDPNAGYCSDWRYLRTPTATVTLSPTHVYTATPTPTANINLTSTAVYGTATHSDPDTATVIVTQYTGNLTATPAAATHIVQTATEQANITSTWVATDLAHNAPQATYNALGTVVAQTQVAYQTPVYGASGSQYEYGDGDPRGEGQGVDGGSDFGLSFSVTRRQGACYTLIPSNNDVFTIEKVELCVEWLMFPRIDMFGIVFPIELVLLPLAFTIIRWVYYL